MPAVAQISVDFASQNNIIGDGLNLQSTTKTINPLTLSRYCLYSREKNGIGENFGAFDVLHLNYNGGFITAGDKINYKHSDLQVRGDLDLEKSVYVDNIFSRRKETSDNSYQTGRTSIDRTVKISALDTEANTSFISIQTSSSSKTTTLKTQHAAINNSIVLLSTSSGTNSIALDSSNINITGIVKSENNASTVWVKSLTGPEQLTTDNYNAINVKDFVRYTFTRGMIMMFSGAVTKGTNNVLVSPTGGWAVCDGTTATYNGVSTITPDLRDRFIVGAGSAYALGNTGGANNVTLAIGQIPKHNHSGSTATASDDSKHSHKFSYDGAKDDGNRDGSGNPQADAQYEKKNDVSTSTDGAHSHTLSIANNGNDESHENRPPYYALYYIIKL